jgi:hypothetical protein
MPDKAQPLLLLVMAYMIFCCQFVSAAVIDDLYDAKIAVANQSEKLQQQGFALALKQVLVKVRGNDDILNDQQIKRAITRATRLVRSYQYDQLDSQLYLVVNFDPQRVETVIRNAGFPIWDKRRPDSLVWLAIDNGHTRETANQLQYPDIYAQFKEDAARRGIALIFPLWDLDDIQALDIYDIWGGFSNQINQASERYSVQSVLSARMYLASDNSSEIEPPNTFANQKTELWLADWTMLENGTLLSGQVEGESQLVVSTKLVDTLANQLSLKYAIDLAQIELSQNRINIVINNVNSLVYYTQVLALLENLSVVNSATLISQQGERSIFELTLLGDVDDLNNALNLDNKIRPIVDDFGQPIGNLEFFWVK